MDNSVVVHEFGHGVSLRLVGGGTASCLASLEARGLGEGWSDALAEFVVFAALCASQILMAFLLAGWSKLPRTRGTSRSEHMLYPVPCGAMAFAITLIRLIGESDSLYAHMVTQLSGRNVNPLRIFRRGQIQEEHCMWSYLSLTKKLCS
jgi:hypothetical protein